MGNIKFGIIGCGRISKKHFDAIINIENVEIAAVCDIDLDKLERFKRLYGIDKGYTNYLDLLNATDIDIVCICAPSGLHARMAIDAMERDKHVILEKPMALKVADAKKIISTQKNTGKSLTVVLQNRLNPPIVFLKENIEKLGKILSMNVSVFWYRPQEYYNDKVHGTREMDGGALMNQGTHYVDMITYLVGEKPKNIFASGGTMAHNMECEDVASLIMEFSDGKIISLQANTFSFPENFEGSITIFFEKATIKIGGKALNEITYWRGNLENEAMKNFPPSVADVYGNGHTAIIKNMVEHLRSNKKLLVTAEDGLLSLEIIEKTYKIINKK